MSRKVEITVDYYKQSGKWYTEETYQIDIPTTSKILDPSETYDIRQELENIISQDYIKSDFIAVVRYSEDVEDIIGYPMMIR